MNDGNVIGPNRLSIRLDDWGVDGSPLLERLQIEYISEEFIPVFKRPTRSWITGDPYSSILSPYGYQPLYVSRRQDEAVGMVGCRMTVLDRRVCWIDISAQSDAEPSGVPEPAYSDGYSFDIDEFVRVVGQSADFDLEPRIQAKEVGVRSNPTRSGRFFNRRGTPPEVRSDGLHAWRYSSDWWWVTINDDEWQSPIGSYWFPEFVRQFKRGQLQIEGGPFGVRVLTSEVNRSIRIAGCQRPGFLE